MRISKLFGLNKSQYELDFVDIDPDADIPLFLDPYFISKMEFPFAEEAYRTLKNYFDHLLALLRIGSIREAEEIFSYLGENNEVCLGLSKGHPAGKGMGPSDTKQIFKSLLQSKAFETGIMEDIEDFRIFVPNVDRDKVSDMTANIIKLHLIDYTHEQCKLWGIPLTPGVPSGFFWNKHNMCWDNVYTDMLIINGEKKLLVPKRIVSFSKEYTNQKYLQHFVLNFLQNEHLRLNSSLVRRRKNKKRYVTKKDARENEERKATIDKEWLAAFTLHHPEIFMEFKANTIKKIRTIDNRELADITVDSVIDYLENSLRTIPAGAENATSYHKTVVGILELLFYPHLSNPKIENEIHEGRKRIDITFDNCAESGFFYLLSNDIPCRYIMVECKNYSRDIKNPELDQLSGRFSPRRGQVGIAACRTIEDNDQLLKRCIDTYKDSRGLIIPLCDDDLLTMLEIYREKGVDGCEELLRDKRRSICLS